MIFSIFTQELEQDAHKARESNDAGKIAQEAEIFRKMFGHREITRKELEHLLAELNQPHAA